VDLSFTPAEQAFALEVRAWLAANVEVPERFETIADEVEFGRRWQARLADEGNAPVLQFNRKRLTTHRFQKPTSEFPMDGHRCTDDRSSQVV
jgi:hypothetical protein